MSNAPSITEPSAVESIAQTNAMDALDQTNDLLTTVVPEFAEKRVKTHLSDQDFRPVKQQSDQTMDDAQVVSSSVQVPKLQKRKRGTDDSLVKAAFAFAILALILAWMPVDTQIRVKRSPIERQASTLPTLIYAQDSGIPFKFDLANGTNLVQFRIVVDADKLDPCKEVQLQVAEGGCGGDQYAVYLDGVLLGHTSVPTTDSCLVKDEKANQTLDMSLPENQNKTLLPGVLWTEGFSAGRFAIPPGDHILTVQLVDPTKGDTRQGSIMMWDLVYYCKYQPDTQKWRGWGLLDDSDHIVWLSDKFELEIPVPEGKCVDFKVYDSVCPGDRYDVSWNAMPIGSTSKIPTPDPANCPYTQMIEGGDHDMGVDYWDLIKPVFAKDRYSVGSWTLGTDEAGTAGNFLLTFNNRGEVGSDYRFSFYIAKPVDCPAQGVMLARGGQPVAFDAGAQEAKPPVWSSVSRVFSVKTTATTQAAQATANPANPVAPELEVSKTEPMVVPTGVKSSAHALTVGFALLVCFLL